MSNPNNMPNIIAICGAKRSGKDVLAQHLVNKYNYERVAFADPLKHAIKSLFNFDNDQVGIGKETGRKDVIDEKWGITPRAALQFFGTEIMQEKIQELLPDMKRNFFSNTLKNYITEKRDINIEQKFVISDLRFLHEYDMLFNISKTQKTNIIIIRVVRPSNCDATTETHISEREYMKIPYDIVLVNDETIENYIKKFDKIISI
jgi:hypothetical protein